MGLYRQLAPHGAAHLWAELILPGNMENLESGFIRMVDENHNKIGQSSFIAQLLLVGGKVLAGMILLWGWLSRQNKKISEDVPSPSFDETAQFDIGFYV